MAAGSVSRRGGARHIAFRHFYPATATPHTESRPSSAVAYPSCRPSHPNSIIQCDDNNFHRSYSEILFIQRELIMYSHCMKWVVKAVGAIAVVAATLPQASAALSTDGIYLCVFSIAGKEYREYFSSNTHDDGMAVHGGFLGDLGALYSVGTQTGNTYSGTTSNGYPDAQTWNGTNVVGNTFVPGPNGTKVPTPYTCSKVF